LDTKTIKNQSRFEILIRAPCPTRVTNKLSYTKIEVLLDIHQCILLKLDTMRWIGDIAKSLTEQLRNGWLISSLRSNERLIDVVAW